MCLYCMYMYSLVWACLCLKFYLEILWSIFIPLKINYAMNNIYQSVLRSCATLSLNSWPLIPLTTIPISETCLVPRVSDKRLCTVQRMWNHLCLISFPYCAGKCTDVFEIQCSLYSPPAPPIHFWRLLVARPQYSTASYFHYRTSLLQ
jgi:hypothetical protein